MTRVEFLRPGDQFKRPGTEEWFEIAKIQAHHTDREQVYFITDEGRTFLFPSQLLLETA